MPDKLEPTGDLLETLRAAQAKIGKAPIVNPPPELIVQLAPQLEFGAAQYLLRTAREEGSAFFATPPLYVRETYHVYKLAKSGGDAVVLFHVCAYRQAGSGSYTGTNQYYPANTIAAAQSYYDQLLEPAFNYTARVELIQFHNGQLTCDYNYILALRRDPREFLNAGYSYPICELLEQSLVGVGRGQYAIDEISAGVPVTWLHVCGLCGGGIRDDACLACLAKLPVLSTGRSSWPSTIPRALADAINMTNKKLKTDPRVARAREHMAWATQEIATYSAPGDNTEYKRSRYLGDT